MKYQESKVPSATVEVDFTQIWLFLVGLFWSYSSSNIYTFYHFFCLQIKRKNFFKFRKKNQCIIHFSTMKNMSQKIIKIH